HRVPRRLRALLRRAGPPRKRRDGAEPRAGGCAVGPDPRLGGDLRVVRPLPERAVIRRNRPESLESRREVSVPKAQVAVLRVRPEGIFADIERLCDLAGMRGRLAPGKTTILKDNISWHFPFPGANTTPWQ